ncbi:MAG: DUF1045 domain-containing protein [Aliishimia sp.]
MFTRYAIFFVPNGAWGAFGASWLGWNNQTGTYVKSGSWGIPDQNTLTNRPRKYGFHATIKAPFFLAQGHNENALSEAAQSLCKTMAPIELTSVRLSRLGRFFALSAPDQQDALIQLSQRAVTELDQFRAPATQAELTRRRQSRLTPAQDALMLQWGYPYVMDQFRFHLTLTGPTQHADLVEGQVHAALSDILQVPLVLDALCLMGEAADGNFHQIARYPFAG